MITRGPDRIDSERRNKLWYFLFQLKACVWFILECALIVLITGPIQCMGSVECNLLPNSPVGIPVIYWFPWEPLVMVHTASEPVGSGILQTKYSKPSSIRDKPNIANQVITKQNNHKWQKTNVNVKSHKYKKQKKHEPQPLTSHIFLYSCKETEKRLLTWISSSYRPVADHPHPRRRRRRAKLKKPTHCLAIRQWLLFPSRQMI